MLFRSLHEGLCHTQVCCTQSPCPCGKQLLTHISTGDTQTLKGRFGSVSVGPPGVHKVLFEPSKCLWQVWGLILNAILPLLPSSCSFSFVLGHEVSFFGGIQDSPVDGCSAVSCNIGVSSLSFLQGVPSKSLFPQSCVISGSSMVQLMATSSKRAYSIPKYAVPRAPAPAAGHC